MGKQEVFFTKKDVERLFKRKKKTYGKIFFIGFCTVLFYHFMHPPLYQAHAVFKQAFAEQNQTDMLRSFLQNSKMASKDSGLQAVFESKALLKQVVQEQGLALHVKDCNFLKQFFCNVRDHIYAELRFVVPERQMIEFAHAEFEGQNPSGFFLCFQEDGCFEVFDKKKNFVSSGSLGVPVVTAEGFFTVVRASNICSGRWYPVSVQSWESAVRDVRSRLKIKNNKLEKTIFSLDFSHPNAKTCACVLNRLMALYQEYLRGENEELAKAQMQYLEKRQQELIDKYEGALQAHANFLHQSLQDTGFVNLKQEVDLLEKPSEDHLKRLYDIDLRLMRLQNDLRQQEKKPFFSQAAILKNHTVQWDQKQESLQDFEGMSPDVAQKLIVDYNGQRERLQSAIAELMHLQGQIFRFDFEVTSLSGVLTDAVSQEMIQKAASVALQLQDTANHSVKDQERLQESLSVQKKFISQHIAQLLGRDQVRLRLLEEKIASLQRGSIYLLQEEKKVIQSQLASFQERMRSFPEKWKRENQLVMQRELSVGMVEGLTQLAESKSIHHHLFHVESKPIDIAYIPYKPFPALIWGQAVLVAILLVGLYFAKDLFSWLGKGQAITQDSAGQLGIAFCGFMNALVKEDVYQMQQEDKETLRKTSAFISLHLARKNHSLSVCVLSESLSFFSNLASLLYDKGLKVLLIECSPSLMDDQKGQGLYDYLMDRSPICRDSTQGWHKIASGGYEGRFVELLCRKKMEELVQESLLHYDVVLLSLQAQSSDAAAQALLLHSCLCIIHAQDVFHEEIALDKPTAVVLWS